MNLRKIIHLLPVFLFVLLFQGAEAQTTTNDWSFYSGGSHSDAGNAVVSDSLGNVYVAGNFQGRSKFSGLSLNASGDTDIFVAKYSKEGELVWIRQAGSNYRRENTVTEYATGIAVTTEGVYLTGVFSRIGIFDSFKLVSAGKDDVFLAKYDLDGAIQWVVKGGGESQDIPYALAVDENENIYLTGSFQKKARFGDQFLHANNYTDMFIIKYGSDGKLLWANQSFSPSKAVGKSIEIYDDQIFIAGEFSKELALDGQVMKARGASDIFIANLSNNGSFRYANSLGSSGTEKVRQIGILNHNIYIVGSFQANASDDIWPTYGSKDVFVQKQAIDGQMVWNKTFGGVSVDTGQSLAFDASGHIVIAGNFNEHVQINDSIYQSNGYSDIYITRMTQNGVMNFFETIGGSNQDHVNQLYINKGDALVTGFFSGSQDNKEESSGGSDIFLSKINLQASASELTKVTYVTYPNPSEGEFLISGNEIIETLVIYNHAGIVVMNNQEVKSYEFKIDLSSMTNGVYLVEINGITHKKMIIY